MPTSILYPLDIDGNSPANLVTETHTVTQLNLSMYRILVPVQAPFYLANFALSHVADDGTITPMIEGADYSFCLPYEYASRALQRILYGGVEIINTYISGTFAVTYQCLGDKWSANRDYVLQAIAASNYNPRQVYWDQVTNVQEIFPPVRHYDDVANMKGVEDLILAMDRITNAILTRPAPTPLEIGLGHVPNLPLASPSDIASRSRVDKFVTLSQVLDLLGL